jgi:hypothetical protein
VRALLLALCLCAGFVGAASASDSLHFRFVGQWDPQQSIWSVAVRGEYAYAAGDGNLFVISVADPRFPVEVARCSTSGRLWDEAVSGKVISVADPLHPVEVGRCDLTGLYGSVAVSGSYVWAGGVGDPWRSMIISVADPANPTVVESLPYFNTDVTMDGDTAYVAAGLPGLRVISIKDPAHPLELGYYRGVGTAQGVALSRGYIFVAVGSALLILQYYGSGVEEGSGPQVLSHRLLPTVIRSLPPGAVAFDATGRRVVNPRAGVYFLRDKGRAAWGGRRNAEGRPAALAAVDGKTGVACRVVAA